MQIRYKYQVFSKKVANTAGAGYEQMLAGQDFQREMALLQARLAEEYQKKANHGAMWGDLAQLGGTLGSFEAWLLLRGLQTLAVRVERQCRTALTLARHLEAHPAVRRVWYPGLASHPQHELAKRQMAGFGGMLSILVKGGLPAARRM